MDHRKYFTSKLRGTGIDIGALHRPMVKHEWMKVLYVDRLPVSELKKHYPELSEFDLKEPNIIDDAQYLSSIHANQFDFVIASHVIEHMSDCIGALETWLRVLKRGGLLYLVVPDKRYIFDRHRPLTELQHIIDDHKAHVTHLNDRDWQHYLEYAELVDKCEGKKIKEHAKKLVETGYSIHMHVFSPESFHDLLIYFKKNVQNITIVAGPRIAAEDKHEFHFLIEKL